MLWDESFPVLYEGDSLIVEFVVAVYATQKTASADCCQFKFLGARWKTHTRSERQRIEM